MSCLFLKFSLCNKEANAQREQKIAIGNAHTSVVSNLFPMVPLMASLFDIVQEKMEQWQQWRGDTVK